MENKLVDLYLSGLQTHLSDEDKLQLSYATGANAAQLDRLKSRFPQCPQSLIDLLGKINGTYWKQYGEHKITVLMLGSDVFEYPYYLKSVEQILENKSFSGESIRDVWGEYMEEMPELVGEGIDMDLTMDHWLCFSDCMNNGGTSQLYIDFNPAPEGTVGQVVRFLHDPDSFLVIAKSFDEYLQSLIDKDFDFIIPEE